MFGNCSFDDAIVALVHLVAKDPTFSILASRFSTHNYRRNELALSITQKKLGPENVQVATSYSNLGSVHKNFKISRVRIIE